MKLKNPLITSLIVPLVILFVLFSIKASVSAGSFAGLSQWHNFFTRPADLPDPQGFNSPLYARVPAVFVPNQGQISDKGVKFQMNSHGEGAFFGLGAFDLSIQDQPTQRDLQTGKATASQAPFQARIQYSGANLKAEVVGIDPLPGKANYLHGSNASNWVTGVSTFAGIAYKDFYSGIDLTITEDEGHLKSSFILSPGVDPSIIQWHYPGASQITLDPQGNLQVKWTRGQESRILSEMAPVAWQERDGQKIPVPVQYVLNDNLVSFTFPASYDASLQLTIDPTLVWGTFISGMSTDRSWDMTLDSQGNIIVTGLSVCWNYPLVNPVQGSGGYYDAIISKLSPDGTTLLASTCLGGSQNEWAWGTTVDPEDNIILTGSTQSSDFPIVAGRATFGGGTCSGEPCKDIFVAKLNPSGNTILYSSYLGGSGTDMANNVVADSSGKIYVAGYTGSTNLPATANAYSLTNHGVVNIAVAKFDPTLTGANSIVYSSYIGGNGDDRAEDIAIDNNGKIYLTGYSNSGWATGFPSVNPIQAYRAGSYDAFVIKMDLSLGGSAGVLFSSYFGGTGDDFAHSIALDGVGKVYITGNTKSSNFPTVNPYQHGLGGGCTTNCQDGFIAKLDPVASQVLYSTYLGGANSEDLTAIAVDNAGRAYVTGYTQSSDYPQLNALMGRGTEGCSIPPCEDALVTALNPPGNELTFSTYLSGNENEEGQGIAVDAAGNIVVSGWTTSGDFPVANGYDVTLGIDGESDVFVVKISSIPPPTAAPTPTEAPPTQTPTPAITLTEASTPTSTITPTMTPISVSLPNCQTPGYCYFGTSLNAGDINGDGLQDILIGAPQYTPTGAVLIYYGLPNVLSGTPSLVLQGVQPGDSFGWSVGATGDVNGDGFGDVIVGAPGCSQSKTHEGCAYIYTGTADGLNSTPSWTMEGNQAQAAYGYVVGSAGDVNGDGLGDVFIGAPNYSAGQTNEGKVEVYYGSRPEGLRSTPDWVMEGNQAYAYFGLSAAGVGDVTGDSVDDLLIGAPNASSELEHEGQTYLFGGATEGLAATASWITAGGQINAHFGEAVNAAGDLNGDGRIDVVVGAPDEDRGETDEGAAFVFLNSAEGLHTQADWVGEGNQAGASYGVAVSGAGDADLDGKDDLLVGANRFTNGEENEGKVYLYYGADSGIDGSRSWFKEGNQPYANFGYVVISAGDLSGDGADDFLIGANQMDHDQVDEGVIYLYSGNP